MLGTKLIGESEWQDEKMIYPDVSIEEWLSKHKGLKVSIGKCNSCGAELRSTVPFLFKYGVGLESPKCPCGSGTNKCATMLVTNEQEVERWNEILSLL